MKEEWRKTERCSISRTIWSKIWRRVQFLIVLPWTTIRVTWTGSLRRRDWTLLKLLSFLSRKVCPVRERIWLNLPRKGRGVSARSNVINHFMFPTQLISSYVTFQISNVSCLAKMPRQEEHAQEPSSTLKKNKAQEPSSGLKKWCLPMLNASLKCLSKFPSNGLGTTPSPKGKAQLTSTTQLERAVINSLQSCQGLVGRLPCFLHVI